MWKDLAEGRNNLESSDKSWRRNWMTAEEEVENMLQEVKNLDDENGKI